ncbi:hypothetical protein [Nocardia sp. alder85J]|uniref:hypothetical protein n=1 Tax=Nocardia sp. alder85J TaxID=2862949 RepID=UPI001CD3124E|nr:hypothetical protein [Nocardia sp. alder85J]MCX4094580.1 hypothetical protein [Nocardia sp. alder85J]
MMRTQVWTGFEAASLQVAMRLSIDKFAQLLGVEPTTVSNWRSRLTDVRLRLHTQEMLDTVWRTKTTEDDRARFEQIVAAGDQQWRATYLTTGTAAARRAVSASSTTNDNVGFGVRVDSPARLDGQPAHADAREQGQVLLSLGGDLAALVDGQLPAAGLLDAGHGSWIDDDLRRWIEMNRRTLLQLFGGGTSALPVIAAILAALGEEERSRMTSVLINPRRVDATAIDDIEQALAIAFKQGDRYGAAVALPTVEAQRLIAEALLGHCPPDLRPRLHALHGSLSQLAGWDFFDLDDLATAETRYLTAKESAHNAGHHALAALALCNLAYLEVCRPNARPRTAIDHVVAAQYWAGRSEDWRMRAYADSIAGYIHAANGDRTSCLTALDSADTVIAAADRSAGSTSSVAYFHGPGLAASLRSDCMHRLGEGRPALQAAEIALGTINPGHTRNHALVHLDLAHAHTDLRDVEAAAAAITASAHLAVSCPSDRLTTRIRDARAGLNPWSASRYVRDLDTKLTVYGFSART